MIPNLQVPACKPEVGDPFFKILLRLLKEKIKKHTKLLHNTEKMNTESILHIIETWKTNITLFTYGPLKWYSSMSEKLIVRV